ncbi:G2/M phase-specific E3 ubiquitin-protein ligase-like isoform X1 [Crassostrea virginica]
MRETGSCSQLNVIFVGEEGVDAGGLTRDFFSLLFKTTGVFDNENFSVRADLLKKKTYHILGRITAKAIIFGHPGPRCLNAHIANYIINSKEPDIASVQIRDLPGDAAAAVQQIQDSTQDTISDVFNGVLSVLEPTGFSKKLSMENKMAAVDAIKAHYLLYRIMGPLTQFQEGLHSQGLLETLRTFPDEAVSILAVSDLPSAEDLMKFYVPQYSSDHVKKDLEERVVYNLDRFLKKIEKNKVSSVWINPMNDVDNATLEVPASINTGHVLQSLIGCQRLPRNLERGYLEFDHDSKNLSTINTCLPSITFPNIEEIQSYENFHTEMLRLIIESYGFGCA